MGDTVELVGQRNEETAQLFGDEQKPRGCRGAAADVDSEVAPAPTTIATEAATEAHGRDGQLVDAHEDSSQQNAVKEARDELLAEA